MFSELDQQYMLEAVSLAERGLGCVAPNPPVGCVLVKNDTVVGRGWHGAYGGPHAEANALADAGDAARGATAYVTLMPCNHTGKTGPCTEALIHAGVKQVVVAVEDPNRESGDGQARLETAGVAVSVGCCQKEAARTMAGFLKAMATGLPVVTYKYAITLDGKTATHTGDSQWISCETSRERVQIFRRRSDAILVGSGTARTDNPRLNVRQANARQPRRVIVDPEGKLPPEARVFSEPGGDVVVLVGEACPAAAREALQSAGAEVVVVPGKKHLDLKAALASLVRLGIHTVLFEGGAGLAGSLLDAGLVDEVVAFVAPRIAGSHKAPGAFAGAGVSWMQEARVLSDVCIEQSGQDVCIRGRLGDWSWLNPLLHGSQL